MNFHQSGRIQWIDFLRGVGILLVVLGHMANPKQLNIWIYSFHMPLFFFLGGLTYKQRSIRHDISRRFISLIIPYFVFGIISILYQSLIEYMSGIPNSLGDIRVYMDLLCGEYPCVKYNTALWFLPSYFVVTVEYNILYILISKIKALGSTSFMTRIMILLICLTSTLLYDRFRFLPFSLWGLEGGISNIVFYAYGAVFISFYEKWQADGWNDNILLEMILTGLLFGLHFIVYDNSDADIRYFTPLLAINAFVLLAFMLSSRMKFLCWIGELSLVILGVHKLVLNLWENACEHIFSRQCPFIVSYVIVSTISVFIAAAVRRAEIKMPTGKSYRS